MEANMEAKELSVIVYGARHLPTKKKGKRKYSVVFGVGNSKFRTDVVQEFFGNPDWNSQSDITVGHHSDKPLKFVVMEKDEIMGQIVIPLADLPHTTTKKQIRAALQAHKKCPDPQGELIYEAWVSKTRPSDAAPEKGSSSSTPLNFKKMKQKIAQSPLLRKKMQLSAYKGGDSESHEPGGAGSLPGVNLKASQSWHNLAFTPHSHTNLTTASQASGSSASIASTTSDVSTKKFVSHWDLTGQDEADISPEVTGLSPKEGPIEGGTRITIRGINLGIDKADVVGLSICGSNCLGSLQYDSPRKLYATTKPWKPCSGKIVIETQTGGKGTSLVQFTFTEPKRLEEDPEEEEMMNRRENELRSSGRSGKSTWYQSNDGNEAAIDVGESNRGSPAVSQRGKLEDNDAAPPVKPSRRRGSAPAPPVSSPPSSQQQQNQVDRSPELDHYHDRRRRSTPGPAVDNMMNKSSEKKTTLKAETFNFDDISDDDDDAESMNTISTPTNKPGTPSPVVARHKRRQSLETIKEQKIEEKSKQQLSPRKGSLGVLQIRRQQDDKDEPLFGKRSPKKEKSLVAFEGGEREETGEQHRMRVERKEPDGSSISDVSYADDREESSDGGGVMLDEQPQSQQGKEGFESKVSNLFSKFSHHQPQPSNNNNEKTLSTGSRVQNSQHMPSDTDIYAIKDFGKNKDDVLERMKELQLKNKELIEENEGMKLYIQNLVSKVMMHCPEILCTDGGLGAM